MKGKRTYQPSRRHRQSTHGFMKRMSDRWGAAVLSNRRRKGRHQIAVTSPKKGQRK